MKIILFLVTLVYFNTAYAKQKVDIYTLDSIPPFAYTDDKGNFTGIHVEIAKKAFERMPDYDINFKVMPWARAKEMAKKGIAFGIFPPYFHAHDWLTDTDKRPYIWPYSLSLATQKDVVTCNKDVLGKPRPHFPKDYKGLKFVMFRGDGRAGEEFNKMVKNKEINLNIVADHVAIIKFLQLKRADCTVTAQLPLKWEINELKKSGKYKKIDKGVKLNLATVINENEVHLGYTDIDAEKNFPFKKDFSIKFDIEIYKMKQSGEIKKIIQEFTGKE